MTAFRIQHRPGARKKTWKKVLIPVVILLITGFIAEQVCEYVERRNYAPAGDIYSINGHDMHIWSAGEGDVTVIFSAGWGMPCPYTDFYPLHSEIVKSVRVAVYDRPGYGWSEVTDEDREIDTITEEIHQLLTASGQTAPYILVGHSIASLELLRFAQLYPDEVKGIVLLDGSYPGMYEHITTSESGYLRTGVRNYALRGINRIGISRLLFNTIYPYEASPLGSGRNALNLMPRDLVDLEKAMYIKTFYNRNHIGETDLKQGNAALVAAAGPIGDIPLVVVTSEIIDSYEESSANQKRMLELSTNSEQVIIEGARHHIHWYAPEIIVKEILNLSSGNVTE